MVIVDFLSELTALSEHCTLVHEIPATGIGKIQAIAQSYEPTAKKGRGEHVLVCTMD